MGLPLREHNHATPRPKGGMKPEDFQPAGYTSTGHRPIFRITHPEDPAFYAEVTLSPPSWRWSVHGRVGMHNFGYAKRKRPAMHAALQSLIDTHAACQNPFFP